MLTLDKIIEQVMEMTGEDYTTTIDQMIKDRSKSMRETRTELKQLGMLRRYASHEVMGRAVNS